MKFRYYLRGLGTGIFVTALVLMIAFNADSARKESKNDLIENTEETTSEDKTEKISEETTSEGETEKISEETTSEEITTIVSSDPVVVIDIYSGMSSNKVSARLEELGVIDDKDEFNNYIYERHMENKIKVGSFSVRCGAEYGEILDIIT